MLLRVVFCHAHAVLSPDPPRCRYRPGPLRGEVLEAYPEFESLLGPLFEALDLATLQRLNGDVAVNGLDSRRVAADFLDGLFELAALAWRPSARRLWLALALAMLLLMGLPAWLALAAAPACCRAAGPEPHSPFSSASMASRIAGDSGRTLEG